MRSLSPLNDNSQCIIDMHLEHGSKLYLTVQAENHAGLRSKFTSSPIIIDKTPPIIKDLNVVTVPEFYGEDSVYSISANWKNEDLESGIKSCFCGLGMFLFRLTHTYFYVNYMLKYYFQITLVFLNRH